MANNYPTIMHQWFEEVWNQRNADTIERLLAADATVHGITDEHGKELVGPVAFRDFQRRFLNAFPNMVVEVVDSVSTADKVAVRCVVRGKHQGDGLGIKATQKEANFTGMCIAHVKNGKVVEAWNNFDFLVMHTQLGTINSLGKV